jgi:pre-mRNA-splicing factor SYF1
MVLNYAGFLEERQYWEDSFRVYEKGVSLFQFPHVKPIWKQYLDKFVARYAGTKLERARDLFEQVKASPYLI